MTRIALTARPGGPLCLDLDDDARRRVDAAREAGIPALEITAPAAIGGGPRPRNPVFLLTGAPRLPLHAR